MYVEQEIYNVNGNILETILLQKTIHEDGHFWILGPGSFSIISISD